MSPEMIESPDGLRRLKVGRPADVWSLGCILYQMIYGLPPFHSFSNPLLKMKAIPDENVTIKFPRFIDGADPSAEGGRFVVPQAVINIMQKCLQRNPKERATIPELLKENWLNMREGKVLYYLLEVHEINDRLFAADISASPIPPPVAPQLQPGDAIINMHFMKQLLTYGRTLAQSGAQIDDELASVRLMYYLVYPPS